MFASILSGEGLGVGSALICSAVSLALGIALAAAYMVKNTYTKSFVISLCVLPIVVQVVIMMVNGNLGASVAVLGAFSLVRFRSTPGSSKEITAVFLSMAIGLATGMGYVTFAAVAAVIAGGAMLTLTLSNFGNGRVKLHSLKITVPEQLDFDDVFADILERFTKNHTVERVKTSNMGSLFEITYNVELKNERDLKEMIDEIRVRNGNLPVVCARARTETGEI